MSLGEGSLLPISEISKADSAKFTKSMSLKYCYGIYIVKEKSIPYHIMIMLKVPFPRSKQN